MTQPNPSVEQGRGGEGRSARGSGDSGGEDCQGKRCLNERFDRNVLGAVRCGPQLNFFVDARYDMFDAGNWYWEDLESVIWSTSNISSSACIWFVSSCRVSLPCLICIV